MKKIRLYQCPVCGNRLSPMKLQAADEIHRLTITDVEDEKLASWQHPMDKAHHLTFLAVLGDASIRIVRLYPEGAQEHRLPRISWARYGCGRSNEKGMLFLSKPEKGR